MMQSNPPSYGARMGKSRHNKTRLSADNLSGLTFSHLECFVNLVCFGNCVWYECVDRLTVNHVSCGDVRVGGDQGKEGEEEREWKRRGGDGGRVQGRHDTAGWLGRCVCRKRKQQGRQGRGRDGEALFAFGQVQTTLTQKSRKTLHCHVNSPVHHTYTHLPNTTTSTHTA